MCLERGVILGIVANCTAEALFSNTVDFANAPSIIIIIIIIIKKCYTTHNLFK